MIKMAPVVRHAGFFRGPFEKRWWGEGRRCSRIGASQERATPVPSPGSAAAPSRWCTHPQKKWATNPFPFDARISDGVPEAVICPPSITAIRSPTGPLMERRQGGAAVPGKGLPAWCRGPVSLMEVMHNWGDVARPGRNGVLWWSGVPPLRPQEHLWISSPQRRYDVRMTATPSRPTKRGRRSIPRRVAGCMVDSLRTLPTMVLYFMQPILFNRALYEELMGPQERKKERK